MLFLTFQIGDQRLALDVRRVREVVPWVPLQRSSSSPAWLAGMFVYRGEVIPVVDLHRLKGAGECPSYLSSRIILVSPSSESERPPIGLLAARVVDVREIDSSSPSAKAGRATVEGGKILLIVDLDRLLPPSAHLDIQALLGGSA